MIILLRGYSSEEDSYLCFGEGGGVNKFLTVLTIPPPPFNEKKLKIELAKVTNFPPFFIPVSHFPYFFMIGPCKDVVLCYYIVCRTNNGVPAWISSLTTTI